MLQGGLEMTLRRVFLAMVVACGIAAAPAASATVTLSIDTVRTSTPSAFRVTGEYFMFLVPKSGLAFNATVTNDAGQPALPPPGDPNYATVDLIARTADGDAVVATLPIQSASPLAFPVHAIQQNTTYLARVNAAPNAGVAAATLSNTYGAGAYLNHTISVNRTGSTVRWSGTFAKPVGVDRATALRVLIQRRSGSAWRTLRTIVPPAKGAWRTTTPTGGIPARFRVRIVAIGAAKRYVPFTALRYCVARTTAAARSNCNSITLGP
jgi:hypothetical protein